MAEAINKLLGANTAKAIDATSVRVNAPSDLGQKVMFASVIENVTLDMDEAPARVIVNSRTRQNLSKIPLKITNYKVSTLTPQPTAPLF